MVTRIVAREAALAGADVGVALVVAEVRVTVEIMVFPGVPRMRNPRIPEIIEMETPAKMGLQKGIESPRTDVGPQDPIRTEIGEDRAATPRGSVIVIGAIRIRHLLRPRESLRS